MEQPNAANTLQQLLNDLYVQPGVTGACLQIKGTVLIHDLPYSDDRVANLAGRVDHLISSYLSVGRTIWQICAGYENFRLLILCHGTMRLSLLLRPEMDPSLAAGRGMHLLMEAKNLEPKAAPTQPQPAVVVSENGSHPQISREDFEKLVASLLGRVTGSAQATKLIQREMVSQKINGSTQIDPRDARRIGLSILEFIPNRGKRAALSSEFLNALDL